MESQIEGSPRARWRQPETPSAKIMGSRNAYLQVTSSLHQKNPLLPHILHLLVGLVVVDAGTARRGLGLALLVLGAHVLLEDGLRLVDLKLGLEVVDVARQATAVRAAAGIVEVEVFVHHLVTSVAPMACMSKW